MESYYKNFLTIGIIAFFASMCIPPEKEKEDDEAAYELYLDSLRKVRCPRLFSSAAEYYKNQNWPATIRVYRELVNIGCDRDDPEEVYQYFAIAYEYLGMYDSSEFVLIKGLKLIPDNIQLRKRLVYAYSRLGKTDLQIGELNRLIALDSTDTGALMNLAALYHKQDLYKDQIDVLQEILKIDPTNEKAQSEIALAYEKIGKDPLNVYWDRWNANPDNVSYGIDLVDRLLAREEPLKAIKVLKNIIRIDNTSKLALRKLGQAYYAADNLADASDAYEELFKLNPRDSQIALKICDVNTTAKNYAKALRWADKAITIEKTNGEIYGSKGDVYYKSFQECRTPTISIDDRIVANLAHQNFVIAEDYGFARFNHSRKWLEDNDVLFTKVHWFMLDDDVKNQGYVKPETGCYDWVNEKLMKDKNW